MMKEEKKCIVLIHYWFQWSFTAIDNRKKKISTHDSGIQISGSHKKPNEIFEGKPRQHNRRKNGR